VASRLTSWEASSGRNFSATPSTKSLLASYGVRQKCVDGFLVGYRALICHRDTKWAGGFRRLIDGAGVRVMQTPIRAPNANA
jgi:hypothetical protein